jgi:uncharacterized repeat protein (TIGR01451 family)
MHARRPRRPLAVVAPSAVDGLERRLLFTATVRTVSLVDDPAYPTTPATAVAVDPYGDVYATRTGGDGTSDTQLVVIPANGSTPQVLTSFAPMIEYANTVESPTGSLVVDAAGDVFGVTQFVETGTIPFGEDSTQGTLWELPANMGTVDVLARFTKPQTAPTSLTSDAAGDLFGTVGNLLGAGSSVFEYPADETGLVTVPLGAGEYCAAVVADSAGDVYGTMASSADPTGPFSLFKVAHGSTFATIVATVPASLGTDVAGLALDASGDLFVTTSAGPNGGDILELPAGGTTVRSLLTGDGQTFNGNPLVDGSGNVFATAGGSGTSALFELPTGSTGLRSVASFATGDATDVTMDALGNLYGTYQDTATGQATVFEVSGATTSPTPTPTPAPTTTPTATVTGLVPMVSRSALPTDVVGGIGSARRLTVSLTDTATTAERGMATVAVYATPAGSAATSGTLIATVSRNVKLSAGGGTSWVVPVRPQPLAEGTYALLAVATDPGGTVLASSAGPALTVTAATVSLAATVAVTPSAATAGGWVTFTLTLTNSGTANSTGLVTAALSLTLEGTATTVSVGTLRRRGTTVRAGGTPLTLKVRVRLPASVPAGSYEPTASVTQGPSVVSAVASAPLSVTASP